VFNRILIANRGEIVNRVMRTAHGLGVQTAVVYSDADADNDYVGRATSAHHIGASAPHKSYLNAEALICALVESGAGAVHPGYGFLSEQADFAEAVEQAGAKWIGPDPETLRRIESKSYCRYVAQQTGVPISPGATSPVRSAEEILQWGERIGYPMLLKLDKGGGGKGIEALEEARPLAQIARQLDSMARIGQMAFACPDVYVERRIERPKHIEVQFVADAFGNVVCLGERECSIQRRYQKIVEEAPSAAVDDQDRANLYAYTAALARAIGYVGAGTIEYLRGPDDAYYFMEINARLQVEHPVSEMITGTDIVAWQILVAAGKPLPVTQEDIALDGHAIEVRIYAEDPVTKLPSPGTIRELALPSEEPGQVRVEHAIGQGSVVSPYYDPMLCKVIVRAANRAACVTKMKDVLAGIKIDGVATNLSANLAILSHPLFASGDFTTGFVEHNLRVEPHTEHHTEHHTEPEAEPAPALV
jgi:acetyl/propionyl-CoA carboxylase alpha subunit